MFPPPPSLPLLLSLGSSGVDAEHTTRGTGRCEVFLRLPAGEALRSTLESPGEPIGRYSPSPLQAPRRESTSLTYVIVRYFNAC